MPCNRPLKGWKSKTRNQATGKFPVVFSGSKAELKFRMTVPCGKCAACQKTRTQNWGVRSVHESLLHEQNSFITLSYNDKHLPPGGNLQPDDFTLFMKRLRKHCEPKQIRYLMCGEYGTKNHRPHYHALIFGYQFPDLTIYKMTKDGNVLYNSKILHKLWGKGFSPIGNVTIQSAQYVAKYINKAPDHLPDLEPPYNNSSRRPGLGIKFLEKNYQHIYQHDFLMLEKRKYKPPRAYDKWLEANHPDLYREIKHARLKHRKETLDQTTEDMQGIASEQIIKQNQGDRQYENENPMGTGHRCTADH